MKTLIVTLLLPLGLLLMGLLAVAVMTWKKQKKGVYGRFYITRESGILLGLFVFGWLFSTPAFGSWLGSVIFSQVEGRVLEQDQHVDGIVVLTGGIVNMGPIAGWMPKPQSIQRVAAAYELQRRINLRLPVIISGGFTEGVKAPSEARAVASFFANQRSEITPTELEEVSTDTDESALQLAPVLGKRQARNIILVTSDVHMLRALAVFRSRGIDAIPAPVMSLPQGGARYYLPSPYGLAVTSEAMYEVYALTLYLVSGKINFSDLSYERSSINQRDI